MVFPHKRKYKQLYWRLGTINRQFVKSGGLVGLHYKKRRMV
jgi:hypothetical protein